MKSMKLNPVWTILLALGLSFALPGLAFGQYGGTPGYVPPAGGYKSSTGLLIGGVAAGGVLGFLLLRHRDSSLTGCVAGNGADATLTTDDHKTFALTGDSSDLKPGERVKLSGKKSSDPSGKLSFDVHKSGQSLGACS